jgi:SHS2 domain-containing protein
MKTSNPSQEKRGELLRMGKGFEFLEHTADVYVVSYGRSLEEAFENAALATMEVMTDTKKVKPEILMGFEVEARDLHGLLYNWLEEILIKFDTDGLLFSKIKILKIEEGIKGFSLRAEMWGEKFNPVQHPQKTGVKAVTYHLMDIGKCDEKVYLKFILDI